METTLTFQMGTVFTGVLCGMPIKRWAHLTHHTVSWQPAKGTMCGPFCVYCLSLPSRFECWKQVCFVQEIWTCPNVYKCAASLKSVKNFEYSCRQFSGQGTQVSCTFQLVTMSKYSCSKIGVRCLNFVQQMTKLKCFFERTVLSQTEFCLLVPEVLKYPGLHFNAILSLKVG